MRPEEIVEEWLKKERKEKRVRPPFLPESSLLIEGRGDSLWELNNTGKLCQTLLPQSKTKAATDTDWLMV